MLCYRSLTIKAASDAVTQLFSVKGGEGRHGAGMRGHTEVSGDMDVGKRLSERMGEGESVLLEEQEGNGKKEKKSKSELWEKAFASCPTPSHRPRLALPRDNFDCRAPPGRPCA